MVYRMTGKSPVSDNIVVLMSTYNGSRYIKEQLASIYSQKGVSCSLLVRDDGSSDDTCSILEKEQCDGKLKWYSGTNLGPAMSFLDLLKHAPKADYYAFSDQDDVWLDDKLKSAIDQLGGGLEHPALYFCQTQLVDKNLKKLDSVKINPLVTYGEALAYQFIGGCTMVFNDALRNIIVQYTPGYMRMHDIWIYDVALAVGASVYFDPIPHILYRQHGDNTVGQLDSCAFRWKARMDRMRHEGHIRSRIASELYNGFKDSMSLENRRLTERVVNYRHSLKDKIHLLCSSDLKCAEKSIRFTSKLAILFNLF